MGLTRVEAGQVGVGGKGFVFGKLLVRMEEANWAGGFRERFRGTVR